MENNSTTTSTVTTVETQETKFAPLTPVFIAFAEYLGYISPFLDWALELCQGNDIPTWQKNVLNAEAIVIFNQMKKDNMLDELQELYEMFFSLVLQDYEDKCMLIKTDDLSF